jgi:hypothetical protein
MFLLPGHKQRLCACNNPQNPALTFGSFRGHNFFASPLPYFGNHVQVKSWIKVSPVQFPRYLHVQQDLSAAIFFTLLSIKAHIRPYYKKNSKYKKLIPLGHCRRSWAVSAIHRAYHATLSDTVTIQNFCNMRINL